MAALRLRLTRARQLLHHPLMLTFYGPGLLVSFAQGLMIPVMPLYVDGFDVSYGVIGLVLAAETLGTMLSDIPAGTLVRRWGTRRLMIAGLAVMGLARLALFWAPSIAVVLVCQLAAGSGRALFFVAQHTYVATSIPPAKRGRALAIFGGTFRVGNFAGPVVGGALAGLAGLRSPFLLFGGVFAGALVMIARFLRDSVGGPDASLPLGHRGGLSLRSVVREHRRILASAGSGQLLAQTIRAGRNVIIPLYAADVVGLSELQIGLVVGIAWAVDMSLFLPAGWIMDRLGRKYAIVPSFVIQAGAMLLVPLTGDFWSLLLVTSGIGLGNGISAGSMLTLGADLAPSEARGEFLGVWQLIGDGGFMSGPLAVGVIADVLALPAAAVVLAGTGLAAALVFGLLVPETLDKGPRPAPSRSSS